jgi:hypothetical protein
VDDFERGFRGSLCVPTVRPEIAQDKDSLVSLSLAVAGERGTKLSWTARTGANSASSLLISRSALPQPSHTRQRCIHLSHRRHRHMDGGDWRKIASGVDVQ